MVDETFPFTFPISFEETQAPPSTTGAGAVQFRVVRQAQGETDNDLYDLRPLREAFDRFASGATLSFIDSDGTKLNEYPYGQRVEIQYSVDGGNTYVERFEGWVVDATRTTRDGLPQLDVDIVGHDHLLRRNTIEKDYTNTTRRQILKDIIETYTAVDWAGGANVSVQVNDQIDFSLRGIRPDSAIAQLASESADEEFGVDNNFDFFFRQQSTSRAGPIGDADIIDHDLPKSGKRSVNRVKMYYGENLDNVIIVEDRQAQKELKDKLGTASNAVISATDSRPEIATEDRAEAIAFEQLGNRDVIQTGEITVPLGRFGTSAGDVLQLTLSDAGIDKKDFRVAQIDYRWQQGETVLSIARQEENNVDDLLISLSDSVTNVKMRDANPNATRTRILGPLRSGLVTSMSATVETRTTDTANSFILGQTELGKGSGTDGIELGGQLSASDTKTVDATAPSVDLHNAIRDRWQTGPASLNISTMAVGDDGSTPTKSDSGLINPLAETSLLRIGDTANADEFELLARFGFGNGFAGTTIQEVGPDSLAGGGGAVDIGRATVDEFTVGTAQSVIVRVVFSLDLDSTKQGVITQTGQERTVDLLLDTGDVEPTTVVYGEGTATPAEADTALADEQYSDPLDTEQDGPPGIARWRERTSAGEADTTNWSEFGLENDSGELLSRIVFEALPEDVILELIAEWEASNG